jgi:hypothetical protein
MNIQTVYIAGPITGKPDGNRQAFAKAEHDLTLMGYRAVNPHKLDHSRAGGNWYLNMRVCIAAMMTCDAIVLLDGWEESGGAQMEIRLATSLAMPWAFMDTNLEFHQYCQEHGQR